MAQSFISEDRERFTIVCEEFIKKTYRLYRIYYTCSGTHFKVIAGKHSYAASRAKHFSHLIVFT